MASLNIATNVGGFGAPGNPNTEIANGSDNDITTTGGFSWAYSSQTALGELCPQGPCGSTVSATGPFSFVIAAGVVRRIRRGWSRSQFRLGELQSIPPDLSAQDYMAPEHPRRAEERGPAQPQRHARPQLDVQPPERDILGRVGTHVGQQAVQLLAQEVECRRPESPRRLGAEEAKQ